MAQITISPTEEELLEALEEYFAPQGFDSFDNIYVQVTRTDDNGDEVDKILHDAEIVIEGERNKASKQQVDVFSELDRSMNGQDASDE